MATKTLLTIDQYAALDEPAGVRYELSKGELIVTPSASYFHNKTRDRLNARFQAFLDAHPTGDVISEMDMALGADVVRRHDVAFIRRDEPGRLHHVAFWLDSWHEVGQAADIIARYDIPLDAGPTRHGITRGQTVYFFDPSGNRNEVFSGGFIYYPDNPRRMWSVDKIGKAVFYYQRELHPRFMGVVT